MAHVRRLGIALATFGLLQGCSSDLGPRTETPSRVPGVSTSYQVSAVAERGEYLDAVLERPGSILRFFFPASEVCRVVVRVESQVAYKTVSVLGTVENEAGVCQSVGIGSLRTWRERRPRQSKKVLPRGSARYRMVYQDDGLTLLRGRFPYANQIGWVGGWDSLAAVPRNDACDRMAERKDATLEYRHAGPDPYRLGTGDNLCVILAFIKPLARAADEVAPARGSTSGTEPMRNRR